MVIISGGGLLLINGSVNLEERSSFVSNAAYNSGGAFHSESSKVRVKGNGRFINNSAKQGGGVAIASATNLNLKGNNISQKTLHIEMVERFL